MELLVFLPPLTLLLAVALDGGRLFEARTLVNGALRHALLSDHATAQELTETLVAQLSTIGSVEATVRDIDIAIDQRSGAFIGARVRSGDSRYEALSYGALATLSLARPSPFAIPRRRLDVDGFESHASGRLLQISLQPTMRCSPLLATALGVDYSLRATLLIPMRDIGR